jgi:alkanesulfonate monooxygenase SsuD/methylene tetrahydromethanopterin reductase-like flavin-dependent oxidoreductase (luciferase family)
VTCPIIRIHPTIIAQAAATVATMMPGRFFLGVGTGENLNEHIQGSHWPPHDVRQEMLEEAIAVLRLLWRGERKATEDVTTPLKTPACTRCPKNLRRLWLPQAVHRPPSWQAKPAMD